MVAVQINCIQFQFSPNRFKIGIDSLRKDISTLSAGPTLVHNDKIPIVSLGHAGPITNSNTYRRIHTSHTRGKPTHQHLIITIDVMRDYKITCSIISSNT